MTVTLAMPDEGDDHDFNGAPAVPSGDLAPGHRAPSAGDPAPGADGHLSPVADDLPLPVVPRGQIFSDPGAATVAAAFEVLDAGAQHALLAELQGRLAAASDAAKSNYDVKMTRAVSALREAAEMLAAEQNVTDLGAVQVTKDDYSRLRGLHPARAPRWPAESTIRSWTATRTWNEALRAARLAAVPDGDIVVRRLGAYFTREECLAAIRDAVADLGWSDLSAQEYVTWSRRLDVRARAGRRPHSTSPFTRHFGSFRNARAEAMGESGSVPSGADRPERQPASVALPSIKGQPCTPEVAITAIRIAAAEIDDAPRASDYSAIRAELLRAAAEAGRPAPVLPHRDTIRSIFPRWDEALEAAGLTPYTPPEQRTIGTGYRRLTGHESYSEDRIRECLRRAFEEIDGRFTVDRYTRWRRTLLARDAKERRRGIPTYACLRLRGFDAWRDICNRYLPEGWDA